MFYVGDKLFFLIKWLIGWLILTIKNSSRVILCVKVRESRSLYIYIYIFVKIFFKSFLFWHTVIWCQISRFNINNFYPVSWSCRIHRLLLCRGVKHSPQKCPGYDSKQSEGETPAILELWEMRSTPSLPSLPGSLWPRVVVPDRFGLVCFHGTSTIVGYLMLYAFLYI